MIDKIKYWTELVDSSMDQAEVINKIRRYRQLLQKDFAVEKMYLFGSYAAGTEHADSDIDVAIIVDEISGTPPEGNYFTYTPLLWKLRRSIDERIEPLLFKRGKDDSGFLQEIIRTGIEIN